MHFNVSGMTCGHCAAAITNAIRQIDPQAAVTIDVAGGTVDVASVAPMAELAEAIEAEGYEVQPK